MSKRTHQRWWIIVVLLVLPLLSLAPVPTALPPATVVRPTVQTIVVPRARAVYRVRLAIHTGAPLAQECSYATASARTDEVIYDDSGMGPAPYGRIIAWSCNGYTAMAETYADLVFAGAMSLGTAIRVALAAPLFAVVLVIGVTSGVLALRQLWILLGPPVQARGGSPAHYAAWLEVRANNFEQTLMLYTNGDFNDGGAEARRVLRLMNDGGAEPHA